jgi:molecular chaperone GrpE (heat shock protein)
VTPEEIAARLDEILREVRRQGRAAIAAQASADACLEAISALEKANEDREPAEDVGAPRSDAESIVRALIPVADAIERIASAAEEVERPISWRERLLGRALREGVLAEPLRLLRSQMESALEAHGVLVDRRVGIPVEGESHRVVETQPGPSPDGEPTVLVVLRPGYALGDRCLREADVIASVPTVAPGSAR